MDETARTDDLARFSRRRVLRGAALLALTVGAGSATGCGLLDDDPAPEPTPDALLPLLAEALDLAGRHETAAAAFGALAARLGPIAETHRAHADELARLTGTPPPSGGPSGTPTPAPPAGSAAAALADLRAAEQRARSTAAEACLAAPADRAALVGSIAAARACHAEVLR
ncbi:hypothetical protein [Plantactinospora sp. GCM10030261]|uniref:hypothetical protein n=1 Tax=Plantactinospora sp. GCM10030261 TaxID=3273420 RepID=UPI003623BE02